MREFVQRLFQMVELMRIMLLLFRKSRYHIFLLPVLTYLYSKSMMMMTIMNDLFFLSVFSFSFHCFYSMISRKMNKIKYEEYFKWKNRSILIENNKKNKLWLLWSCCASMNPFTLNLKAEKSSETSLFFSYIFTNQNNNLWK